jgi:hypothetical protein
MGRSKRTEEVRAAILASMGEGATDTWAFQAAGISSTTFYDWVRGDAGFASEIKRVRAVYYLSRLKVLQKSTAWQAVAWELERRAPEEFALDAAIERALRRFGLIEGEAVGE